MAFKAELPPDVKLPEGHRIDTADPRYKALEELATRERWSQAAFSSVLSIEAGRVSAAHANARAAAPPPPPPAPKIDYAKLSTTEKFQLALEREATKRGGG